MFSHTLILRLRAAQHVAVLTGAGISAESGIPTFRDAQTGLWAKYAPEDLASPQAFRSNPGLVWEWYAWRRALVENCAPNPGHLALVTLARHVPRLTLITQNVDRLHQRAGSVDVLELHGSLFQYKCFDRQHAVATWPDDGTLPPRCPQCGSYVRPDVVWFGEGLDIDVLGQSVAAAETADLFLTIGTSGIVYPAAQLPILALEHGAYVVEINPDSTPLTPYVTEAIGAPSGVALPQLVAQAWETEGT